MRLRAGSALGGNGLRPFNASLSTEGCGYSYARRCLKMRRHGHVKAVRAGNYFKFISKTVEAQFGLTAA